MKSDQPDNPHQPAQDSNPPARLGGARADFVASLGRKVNDARGVLAAVEAEHGTANERAPREELRRRLHALGASARMLRFEVMSQAIADAEAALERAAQAGRATEEEILGHGRARPRRPPRARLGRWASPGRQEAK